MITILKRALTTMTLAITISGFSGLTNAETWYPADQAVALASVGSLQVSKGIFNLNCDLSGAVGIANGNASVTTMSVSGAIFNLCGRTEFEGRPYNMKGNADGTVTMEGILVIGGTGNCAGDLTGSFDQSTGILTFDHAELPGSPSGAACILTGDVATNPQASYTSP